MGCETGNCFSTRAEWNNYSIHGCFDNYLETCNVEPLRRKITFQFFYHLWLILKRIGNTRVISEMVIWFHYWKQNHFFRYWEAIRAGHTVAVLIITHRYFVNSCAADAPLSKNGSVLHYHDGNLTQQ